MLRLILILNFALLGVFSTNTFGPKCKLSIACITKFTRDTYKSIFKDENNHLDPVYQKIIEGDLESLKYTLRDTSVTGYKTCIVTKGNLDLNNMQLAVDMYCPEFHLDAMCDVVGSLMDMPIDGSGHCTVDSRGFVLKIRMEVSLIPNGEYHNLHINNYNIYAIPIGRVTYNLTDLYKGQKDQAEEFLKFMNANWKLVTYKLQEPVFISNFKEIIKVINEFYKKLPIENYIEF